MFTKSLIQQQAELINSKNEFKSGLANLMEKYNIEDSIFIYNGRSVQEVCGGYFEVQKSLDSLNQAISECDITTSGIRIMYNTDSKITSFQVGKVHKFLNECQSGSQVLDIDRLKYIN